MCPLARISIKVHQAGWCTSLARSIPCRQQQGTYSTATSINRPRTSRLHNLPVHARRLEAFPTARRRPLSTTAPMSATPTFSEGSDDSSLSASLSKLTAPHGEWTLTSDGRGLERSFKFKTFKAAWAFMNDTAEVCKTHKHHPEWSNAYNVVYVRWTTHNPKGLSKKDVEMAMVCDKLSGRDDSQAISMEAQADTTGLKETAGRASNSAEDCCEPRDSAREKEKAKVEREEGEEGKEGSVAGIGGQPT